MDSAPFSVILDISPCYAFLRFLFVCAVMDEAIERELQALLRERYLLSLERKRLRQLQKNERRKRDRLKRKAAQLLRRELLELANDAPQ